MLLLTVGLVLSSCGAPWIAADSGSRRINVEFGEESGLERFEATIVLAPGALEGALDAEFHVIGPYDGLDSEVVPLVEVAGGDPLTVAGRLDELGSFDFEWDWELPADCDQGCEVTWPVEFRMIDSRGGAGLFSFTAGYRIQIRFDTERPELDGVVTVERVP